MPGHNPHRPEGKAADAEHDRRLRGQVQRAFESPPGDVHPTRFPAEEQVGGSRPGVESRVKAAIEERDQE